MGPGWFCDGCGDYRMHDGKESYSVRQRELADRTVELAKALSRAIDHIADSCSDHPIVEELDNILLGKAPQQSSTEQSK